MIDRASKRQLLLIATTLAITCVLILAPESYLPMLARAFMIWWSIGFFSLALFALWRRMHWWAVANALVSPLLLLQLEVQIAEPVAFRGNDVLRLAHMNVLQPNEDRAQAIATVLATDADLISVQEVSPEWARALMSALSDRYPYHHIEPRTNCYGIALFSRHPFDHVRTIHLAGAPLILADLRIAGEELRVYTVHATSPGSYEQYRRRNAQLHDLATMIGADARPTVIIGDLNTVHWDAAYRDFCVRSGSRPINSPFTITWPSVGPFALMPLDHALITGGLRAGRFTSFNISGSDHRGLLAEVHLDHAR